MAHKPKKMCACASTRAGSIMRLARTCQEKQDAVAYFGRTLAAERAQLPARNHAAFDKVAVKEFDRALKNAGRACGTGNDRFAKARSGLFGLR